MKEISMLEVMAKHGIREGDQIKVFADGRHAVGRVKVLDEKSVTLVGDDGSKITIFGTTRGKVKLQLKLTCASVSRIKVGDHICIDGRHEGTVYANNEQGVQMNCDNGTYFGVPTAMHDGRHWVVWTENT